MEVAEASEDVLDDEEVCVEMDGPSEGRNKRRRRASPVDGASTKVVGGTRGLNVRALKALVVSSSGLDVGEDRGGDDGGEDVNASTGCPELEGSPASIVKVLAEYRVRVPSWSRHSAPVQHRGRQINLIDLGHNTYD